MRRQWLVRAGIGTLAVLVLLVLGAWLLLRSDFTARQLAARLEAATGAPVRVAAVSVGLSGSTLSGLEFHEDGAAPGAPAWAVVPEVVAELSLAQLARGDLGGGTVTLRNASVTLRLDRNDKLLTKLPAPEGGGKAALPGIRVENSRITFQREGRPDTVFAGISGEIRSDPNAYEVTGTADDPDWGTWSLAARREREGGATSVRLHTDRIHLTPDKLRAVPFVPAVTWEHVAAEGDTPVDLTLSYAAGSDALHYRVALQPADARITVPSIDLTAVQAGGRVVVEDGVVRITDLRGQAAGGELRVDSTMDFNGPQSALLFNVDGRQLVLKDLPRGWGLPPFEGRMNGRAYLELHIEGGRLQTLGEGSGTIEGFLTGTPLQVRMLADGRRYRFDVSNQAGARAPVAPDAVTGLLLALAIGQPPAAPPPVPAPPVNDLELNFNLKDVDLRELVQRLNVVVPFDITGRLTVAVKATIPLRDVKDLKAYRFHGTVELPWARLEGLELHLVKARVVYDQGVLRLDELSARVPDAPAAGAPPPAPGAPRPGGTVAGSAAMGLVPLTELTAKLTIDRLPLGPVLAAIPNITAGGGGVASGAIELRAPAQEVHDLSKWEASGRVQAVNVQAFGRAAQELTVRLRLERGTLTLAEARGRLQGAAVAGRGTLQVTAPYRFEARLDLPPSELRAWQQVVPELRAVRLGGRASVSADVRGTLEPLAVQAGGAAQVDELAVNDFKVGTLRFRYDLDTDRLRLTDLRAGLYGGELTGTATVPLKPEVAGAIDLELKKLDTANLTKDVPQTPVRLEGQAEGSVRIALPSAAPGRDREITADIHLSAERLRVQNVPADRLKASVVYRNGAADYKIEGQTLGGTFELSGQYPPRPAGDGRPPSDRQGRLRLRGLDLARLGDVFQLPALRPLGGRLMLEADFVHTGAGLDVSGDGRVLLDRLSWDRWTLIDELRGDVRLVGSELRLSDLAGRLAGGGLRARLVWNLRDPRRSFFTLSLDRADAQSLLEPFTDSPPLDGPLDVRLRGRVGTEWSGTGEVVMGRGKLLGLTVTDLRAPLGLSVGAGGRGMVRVTDATAQAAQGRIVGRAEYSWGADGRLDGQARFSRVDLGELLSEFTDSKIVGGTASGRIDFGGRNVRSASDVTAAVDASFAEAPAAQLPVVRQLMPFILPGRSGAWFGSGDLRGNLAGGVFRIQRLTLVGRLARVFAEGTVTLQQRLDLDVVASTHQVAPDPIVMRGLSRAMPSSGPLPLGVINQASSALSSLTIRLHVGGTVRAPSIQVNRSGLLTEGAIRFFVR